VYKFYFPFYYLFYSRLKTKIDQISWFIIFIIPPFLIAYVYSEINLLSYIVLFLLFQIIFNILYKVVTTKNKSINFLEKIKNFQVRNDSFDEKMVVKKYYSIYKKLA